MEATILVAVFVVLFFLFKNIFANNPRANKAEKPTSLSQTPAKEKGSTVEDKPVSKEVAGRDRETEEMAESTMTQFVADQSTGPQATDNLYVYDFQHPIILDKYSPEDWYALLRQTKEAQPFQADRSLSENLQALEKEIPETRDLITKMGQMPNEILKSAAQYPDNFLWVYEFPGPYEPDKASLTKEELAEGVPYLFQKDSRWGYFPVGHSYFGLVGCGPTCFSMVMVGLTGDSSWTPDRVMSYMLKHKYYNENDGTLWAFYTDAAKDFGLKAEHVQKKKESVIKSLQEGKLLIANVGPGDFTARGHYIVLAGEKDGSIDVHDPNSWVNSEKIWTYEALADQIKGIWSFEKN